MELPNADQARVDPRKVRDYLLAYRPKNDKSEFFLRFGFRRDQWHRLQVALLRHGAAHSVNSMRQVPNGVNYVVVGPIETPDGRQPMVATVWHVSAGEPGPRFITARPT